MMGKLEFLDALKRAMAGLPPDAQAKTLAFYEQRFVDGEAAGQTEQDIAKAQGDPKKIAMTLRANTHMQAFETKKNPANLVRMLVATLGLAVFNLFMVVPAMVYASLLAALYACGLAFYLAGTVVTASGLSGANEIKLDGPLRNVLMNHDVFDTDDDMQTKVNISETGIEVFSERAADGKNSGTTVSLGEAASAQERAHAALARANDAAARAGDAAARAGDAAARAGDAAARAAEALTDTMDDDEDDSGDRRSERVAKRVESVASHGIVFSTATDDDSRATQTAVGLAMIVGGIILLLLSLVVTRYTFIGLKRYIEMNFSLLKGN
ncbi:MAG: DUF1700 domain-containing protein [Pseudomonadota bacterium]